MRSHFFFSTLLFCFCLLATSAFAQRVAILVPEKSDRDFGYAQQLGSVLPRPLRLQDLGQGTTAFRSLDVKNPYNMTAVESRAAASVMGCEYIIVVRTGGLRRESFSKSEYYEAYSVIYLVSGRTGLLAGWWLKSFEAENQ